VLIISRSKLYYTASGIITPVGGRPVHRLREDSDYTEMHGQESIKTIEFIVSKRNCYNSGLFSKPTYFLCVRVFVSVRLPICVPVSLMVCLCV